MVMIRGRVMNCRHGFFLYSMNYFRRVYETYLTLMIFFYGLFDSCDKCAVPSLCMALFPHFPNNGNRYLKSHK